MWGRMMTVIGLRLPPMGARAHMSRTGSQSPLHAVQKKSVDRRTRSYASDRRSYGRRTYWIRYTPAPTEEGVFPNEATYVARNSNTRKSVVEIEDVSRVAACALEIELRHPPPPSTTA